MFKKENFTIILILLVFLISVKMAEAPFSECPGDTTNGIWELSTKWKVNLSVVCYNITIKAGGQLVIENGTTIINITTGNLSIEVGGLINATGTGYAGGANSGDGPGGAINRSAGGSFGGRGGTLLNTGVGSRAAASVYGNPLEPLDIGSGGAGDGTRIGYGGGGSVLINVTQELSLQGRILADGNKTTQSSFNVGAGSVGSILVYTYNLTGSGNFSAKGGVGRNAPGGGGRIAIYYNYSTLNLSKSSADGGKEANLPIMSSGSFIAIDQTNNNATIYNWNWNSTHNLSSFSNVTFVTANTSIDNPDIIKIDNNFLFDGISALNCRVNMTEIITFSELQPTGNVSKFLSNFRTDCGGVNATINGSYFSGPIIISNNPTLNFSSLNIYNNTLDMSILNSKINANINFTLRNLTLDTDSSLNATGRGYQTGTFPTSGPGGPLVVNNIGGSYGGRGMSRITISTAAAGQVYGNPLEPRDLGSGAGQGSGGHGGGVVYINATNNLVLNGQILAEGGKSLSTGTDFGGGSGGSILVYTYNLTGSGNFSAKGGFNRNAPGGGGRIAIYYNYSTLNLSKSSADGLRVANVPIMSSGSFIAIDQTNNNATIYNWNWNSTHNLSSFSNVTFVTANTSIDNPDIIKIDNNFLFDGISALNCRVNMTEMITFSELQPTGNVSKFLSNFRTDCGGVNATINGSYFSGPIIISNNPTLNFSSLNIYNNTLDMSILNSKINANINFTLRNLTLDTDSSLNATGRGYAGGISSGEGLGGAIGIMTGGSYGGRGGGLGSQTSYKAAGQVYGNPLEPKDLGSGGSGDAANNVGEYGGGIIYINATNKFTINGIILADGKRSHTGVTVQAGAGSGGSILVYTY